MVALVDVSEAARERETFRYDSNLIQSTVHNFTDDPISASQLRSSPDSALTAFAQLAVLRLKTSRALISLFDTASQYIVAEATPDLSLQPTHPAGKTPLWLSGTAIPRSHGICEYVLTAAPAPVEDTESGNETLPVSVVNDLAADPRFADRSFVKSDWPQCRFYAGVPIRTNHGVNIGVFCVFDDEPRSGLAADDTRFMWELSKIIMGHLKSKRATQSHGRTERMVRGISSFIDGSTTLTKNRFDVLPSSDDGHARVHDSATPSVLATGMKPQTAPLPPLPAGAASIGEGEDASDHHGTLPAVAKLSTSQMRALTASAESTGKSAGENDDVAAKIRKIYTKAAKALCSSLDVEGLVFLGASVTSFGGASASDFRSASATSSSSSSSSSSSGSDERPSRTFSSDNENDSSGEPFAPVLGFSGMSLSTTQDDSASHHPLKLPQQFLRRLLRRYPKGTIFNFNESGTVQSSDFSSEEASADQDAPATPHEAHRKRRLAKRSRMKQSEQEMLMRMLPAARCIAFAPVWDPSTQRFSAGTFAYTKARGRVFSSKGELSYLIAFGTIVMSEVSRLKATMADKSKMDMLSSLSHELRSPLHGVVLGVEMLYDSALDRFQRDVLRTVETCGRTLLDTVDHLLHWAKINNFNTEASPRHARASGARDSKRDLRADRRANKSVEAGMMSITTNVAVDALAEEVIESVFAGHTYQKLIVAHAARTSSVEADRAALRQLDRMHVAMDNGSMDPQSSEVVVSLDVEPNVDWVFHTQAGALRRVIMNLLGNSLKYTAKGFIEVTLRQRTSPPYPGRARARRDFRNVCLTVSDSGKGISEEYLKNHLFVPFSQEDRLSPGVGLGLSLVKKIVSGLGGRIKVQSSVGSGTIIMVELLLEVAPSPKVPSSLVAAPDGNEELSENVEFERHVGMLRGLRVSVVGFKSGHSETRDRDLGVPGIGKRFDEHAALVAICRDWLHMTVLEASADGTTKPDLVICGDAHLDGETLAPNTPAVVICRNAAMARVVDSRHKNSSRSGLLEFSSQP